MATPGVGTIVRLHVPTGDPDTPTIDCPAMVIITHNSWWSGIPDAYGYPLTQPASDEVYLAVFNPAIADAGSFSGSVVASEGTGTNQFSLMPFGAEDV